MAEQFAFDQVARQRRAVDGHKGRLVSGPRVVQGPRHQLLSGPRGAQDEHRARGRGHLGDQLPHLLHRQAAAHDAGSGAGLGDRAPQVVELALQPVVLADAPYLGEEILGNDGLQNVICGASAEGLDRRVEGAEGGEHDDGRVGAGGRQPPDHFEAADPGHDEIGEHQLGIFLGGQAQTLLSVLRRPAAKALGFEQGREVLTEEGLVVDDQDVETHLTASPAASPAETAGSTTVKVEPRPASLSTSIRPPWALTRL